ncbi:4-coumarate--coa ligase-like 4 [Plakobranchus ocellatus]|uniref:4-coumarate--coa ligase-like 4 n=1 Tax=Plakobranchus ocellatus TaxID=259542 RepID=A0AAV4DYP8_9GAST|nr:4-coumarate--coa ligase-like 4 [Plakobranchus ocellatus]
MVGYHKNEKATAETISPDGWLYTVRKNRLEGCGLKGEKGLKKEKRSAKDNKAEVNSNLVVVRWFDNRKVNLISLYFGVEPGLIKVQRPPARPSSDSFIPPGKSHQVQMEGRPIADVRCDTWPLFTVLSRFQSLPLLGDVGYFDKDGLLFVQERLKELIKYKGSQVAPAELEAVLLSHPDIQDVAVIGVPDQAAGELPKAFVVARPGSKLTEDQVTDFMKGKVAPSKWLRGGVQFVEEIPKNPSGKILRRIIREKYL